MGTFKIIGSCHVLISDSLDQDEKSPGLVGYQEPQKMTLTILIAWVVQVLLEKIVLDSMVKL